MKILGVNVLLVLMVLVTAVSGWGTEITDDFAAHSSSWQVCAGKWVFTDGILRQQAVNDYYPLILRNDGDFTDVDVTVKFRPVSGEIDASGGIVFRAVDKKNYYVVRANALENNFRLYTVTNGWRRQIASATVAPPQIGQFHQLRVVAEGNRILAYLNGKPFIDHRDSRFGHGKVGLWTKADSVTEFDDFVARSLPDAAVLR